MTKKCYNKKCIHKGKPQPYSNFNRKLLSKYGYASECRDCRKARYIIENEKAKERRLNEYDMFIGGNGWD